MQIDSLKSSRRSVSLLFSGGADSTLSAALLAENFNDIHLVTFKHYSEWNVRSSKTNAIKLRAKFPQVEFKHIFLNCTKLFVRLQRDFLKDFPRYRYFTLFICGACKLAMHTELIIYNLKNNIKYAASGVNYSMNMFPDQTDDGIKELEEYDKEYGIKLLSPVYSIKGVDKIAVEMGIMDKKHLKVKHKASWTRLSDLSIPIKNMVDNTQGFCLWIPLIDLYIAMVRSRKDTTCCKLMLSVSKIAAKYYNEKINKVCRNYIELHIKQRIIVKR